MWKDLQVHKDLQFAKSGRKQKGINWPPPIWAPRKPAIASIYTDPYSRERTMQTGKIGSQVLSQNDESKLRISVIYTISCCSWLPPCPPTCPSKERWGQEKAKEGRGLRLPQCSRRPQPQHAEVLRGPLLSFPSTGASGQGRHRVDGTARALSLGKEEAGRRGDSGGESRLRTKTTHLGSDRFPSLLWHLLAMGLPPTPTPFPCL